MIMMLGHLDQRRKDQYCSVTSRRGTHGLDKGCMFSKHAFQMEVQTIHCYEFLLAHFIYQLIPRFSAMRAEVAQQCSKKELPVIGE